MSTVDDGAGLTKINPRHDEPLDAEPDRGQEEVDPQGRYRAHPVDADRQVVEPDEPYEEQQLDPASSTPDPDAPGTSALHPIDEGAVEPNEPG